MGSLHSWKVLSRERDIYCIATFEQKNNSEQNLDCILKVIALYRIGVIQTLDFYPPQLCYVISYTMRHAEIYSVPLSDIKVNRGFKCEMLISQTLVLP